MFTRQYGAVQYSVFRCDLTKREMVELRGMIHHREDGVLFVDVGPAATRGKIASWWMGRTYVAPEDVAVVVLLGPEAGRKAVGEAWGHPEAGRKGCR